MIFPTEIWYCAARAVELSTKPISRIICNEPIVLFRTLESGQYVALEDRCPHRQAPLSMGRVVGEEIMCQYHGWMMNADGRCTHVPHQDSVSPHAVVKSYPIVEKWGLMWLWIGEADRADKRSIPDMPWLVSDDHSTILSRFYSEANYQLMADNLLDVSHADFLHANSFGSQAGRKGKTDNVKQEMEVTTDNTCVTSVRILHDVALGPMAAAWGGFTKNITRTTRQRWEPPNTVMIELTMANEENRITFNHDHMMTPETETTSHYFLGFTRDFNLESGYPTDEDMRREQESVVRTEDIPMVEAQQLNRNRFGTPQNIPGQADKFLIAVHKRIAEHNG
ncbi:MAG: aromatic ring-hydroxylating dioxygenase subunit alpha [Pseudomonadota bacterium]|nr:aromatic ring-hydroxylating dioxygenase subunit alpha [Pseudomonadota bacterium]